jgi:copper homeostasis protein CutC
MRRIRQIEVGGIVVGLTMLDDAIDDELMKQITIYNYVPEAAYRTALLREYEKKVTP